MHVPTIKLFLLRQSICAMLMAATALCANTGQVDDMETIKARLRTANRASSIDVRAVQRLLDAQRENGSWPDIDYAGAGRTRWSPATHMSRILTLAQAHESDTMQEQRGGLLAGIEKGLAFWYANDFICPNWWYNQIGVPRVLYRALLLVEDDIAPETLRRALPILERAKLGMTGQNLVWVAETTIARGCLIGDPAVVNKAFDRIAAEIRVSSAEGIQADLSFWQHGNQLYSGGYGRGFSSDCPYFAALADGTGFAFPPKTIELLCSYVLDGQQWMIRAHTFDYSACGREIARRGGGSANSLARACTEMLKLHTARQKELEAFAARLTDPSAAPLTGLRHFWRSDLTTYHRPELYASVRLTSKRVRQTETCNSENLFGRLLSDGVNYIMRRGDEYERIFPVWDWKRLPGITVLLDDTPPTTRSACGDRTFAGGVSDGLGGMSAMDFARGQLSARKAWFFCDAGYMCLGAGISCKAGAPVITSVNQCWLRGETVVGDADSATTVDNGEHPLAPGGWVHHDGVLYTFAPEQAVLVRLAEQTGNWWHINHSERKDDIRKPVFNAWIEHGKHPSGASYAYSVQAAPPPEDGHVFGTDMRILRNDRDVQAAHCPADVTTGIVFYVPAQLDMPDLGVVSADQPCMVHIRRENSRVQVSICNPENAPGMFGLHCATQLAGDGAVADGNGTHIRMPVPGGLYAGKSVTRTFTLGSGR